MTNCSRLYCKHDDTHLCLDCSWNAGLLLVDRHEIKETQIICPLCEGKGREIKEVVKECTCKTFKTEKAGMLIMFPKSECPTHGHLNESNLSNENTTIYMDARLK
jgi:hypothetical protein